MMEVKIGKGKLAEHNKDIISIPIEVNPGGDTRPFKFIACVDYHYNSFSSGSPLIEFKEVTHDKGYLQSLFNFRVYRDYLTEADKRKIIEEADRCRSDPEQLDEFNKLRRKQALLVLSEQIRSGMTPEELHSLVDEAVVSSVQNG